MKKLSESIWCDIQDRSTGEQVRREDEPTNIKDIKPVDMGVSVLWADKDLETKDGTCHFNYKEAEDLIKNSGWRLPSKDETYQLIQFTKEIKNTDEIFMIEGDFDNAPQLIFDKKGYKLGDIDQIISLHQYMSWTSSKRAYEIHWMNVLKEYTAMQPMDDHNKICVRLVKDR